MGRDAVEVGELVRADPERGQHRRVELANGPPPERFDPVVERANALHRAVGDLLGERAVALVERRRGRCEGAVGVRVVLEHAPHDLVRGAPGGRDGAHGLRPRRKSSYAMRVRPPAGRPRARAAVLDPALSRWSRDGRRARSGRRCAARAHGCGARLSSGEAARSSSRSAAVSFSAYVTPSSGWARKLGSAQHVSRRSAAICSRPLVHGPGVIVRADRERLLGRDRARVELLHELDDRHAGLGVAGHDRALDRGRPAPARQQRRVDVEPEVSVEQGSAGRSRRRRTSTIASAGSSTASSSRSGWSTGMPSRSAMTFAGGGSSRRPAARRPIGPREAERDLVPCREPLEDIGSERCRRGEAECGAMSASGRRALARDAAWPWPRAGPRPSCGRSSARRRDGRARAGSHARCEAFELERDRGARGVLRRHRDRRTSRSTGTSTPEGRGSPRRPTPAPPPAATSSGLTSAIVSPSSLVRMTNTRRSTPTCVAARPAPSASSMIAVMPLHELVELAVERLDLLRPHAQHGVWVLADLRERDEPSELLARDPVAPRLPPRPRSRRPAWCLARSPRRQCTPRPGTRSSADRRRLTPKDRPCASMSPQPPASGPPARQRAWRIGLHDNWAR